MPRPRIRKRVCCSPAYSSFQTGNQNPELCQNVMSVEEFETIRLIDKENLSQEQCALQMEVSRPTVQILYSSARAKIANLLVEGESLGISGGHYSICDNRGCQHRNGRCGARNGK